MLQIIKRAGTAHATSSTIKSGQKDTDANIQAIDLKSSDDTTFDKNLFCKPSNLWAFEAPRVMKINCAQC